MNTEAFITAYNASRNGANGFIRNPLYPRFLYSDGVFDCANAGCHWLLDILGTELPGEFRKRGEYSCMVTVKVSGSKAIIVGDFEDDDPNPYIKHVDYTDMPKGDWKFYVTNDGESGYHCILLTEY